MPVWLGIYIFITAASILLTVAIASAMISGTTICSPRIPSTPHEVCRLLVAYVSGIVAAIALTGLIHLFDFMTVSPVVYLGTSLTAMLMVTALNGHQRLTGD